MTFKKLWILVCFLLVNETISAQSLYHLQFRLPEDNIDYHGFLVLFDDGTGIMRLRYLLNNEDIVLEGDANERQKSEGETADSLQTIFDFTNTRLIAGPGVHTTAMPAVVFTVNKSTGFAEPTGVIPRHTSSSGSSTSFFVKHIPMPELQKNFLLQFFSEDDDFYKSIFQTVTKGLSPVEKKTSLRLLIVANTKEKIIGGSCALDKERILQSFTELTNFLGIKLLVDSVAGNNYSKKSVEEALRRLKPAPQDIVVFYYSGHGYRRPGVKSRYPFIDLRAKPSEDHVKQSLGMEDIYASIKKKGARTNLVLSDCCNNDVSSTNIVAPKPMKTKNSGMQWHEENIKTLFFNKSAVSVLATSADTGEKASGNEKFGGFFSHFFKSSMENYCSKLKSNPSWDVILTTAKMQTIQKASKTYCSKPYVAANICKQSPYYTIEIGR